MSETHDEVTNINDRSKMTNYKFVLRHVFKNLFKCFSFRDYKSDTENHFGIPWSIGIEYSLYQADLLRVTFHCELCLNEKEWSIDTNFEIHVVDGQNGNPICKVASHCFTKTDGHISYEFKLNRPEFSFGDGNDDELVVEIRLKTMKTTGIYKENLRDFDNEEFSDMTLVVDDRSFHVAKWYLSFHSLYFKTMFLGGFEESKKSEIKLSGVDAEDLQKYLEALYGEDAIDEMSIEGILLLADMYDTKFLVEKCEKFLLESSNKSSWLLVDRYEWGKSSMENSGEVLKKKLELARRYNLIELKNKCLSEIKTVKDVRAGFIHRWNYR
ncbi:unnamed protein product [Caenorhabditis brenneri]